MRAAKSSLPPPDGTLVIDLIGRLGDAFRFEDLESQEMDVEGVCVPVATPRTLNWRIIMPVRKFRSFAEAREEWEAGGERGRG